MMVMMDDDCAPDEALVRLLSPETVRLLYGCEWRQVDRRKAWRACGEVEGVTRVRMGERSSMRLCAQHRAEHEARLAPPSAEVLRKRQETRLVRAWEASIRAGADAGPDIEDVETPEELDRVTAGGRL